MGMLQHLSKTKKKKGKLHKYEKKPNNFMVGKSESVLKFKNSLHKHSVISEQIKTIEVGGRSMEIFIVN